jgi:hypothetical protein
MDDSVTNYRDHYCHNDCHDHVDHDGIITSVSDGRNDDNDARDRC